jgi:hypothetical protein
MDAIRIGLGDISGARLLDLSGAAGAAYALPGRTGDESGQPASELAFGQDRVTLSDDGRRLSVYRPPAPPPPEPAPEWEVLAAKAAAEGPWREVQDMEETESEEDREQSAEDQMEQEVTAESDLEQTGQLAELIRQLQQAVATESLTDELTSS